MKLVWKFLPLVLAVFLILSALSACNSQPNLADMKEEDRVTEIFRRSDEKMSALTSYTIDISANISLTLQGIDVSAALDGDVVTFTSADGKLSVIETQNTEMVAKQDGKVIRESVSNTTQGYQNGYMFQTSSEEGSISKLYAPLSQADYEAHRKAMSEKNDVDIEKAVAAAAQKSCTQNENGTWTVKISGMTADDIQKFDKTFGFTASLLPEDTRMTDVILTVTFTEDLYYETIAMEFTCEKTEDAESETDEESSLPVLTIDCQVKNRNTTEAPKEIDFSQYTEVEDLRIVEILKDKLDDHKSAEAGAFQVNSSNNVVVTVGSNVEKQYSSEEDEVSFTNKTGAYTYEIKAVDQDGTRYLLTYADGEQYAKTTKKGSSSSTENTVDCTDFEAKNYINKLIDAANFNVTDVTSVKILDAEKGQYRIGVNNCSTLNEILEQLEKSYTSIGGMDLDGTAYLEITVENDILTHYDFCIEIEGEGSYSGQKIVLDMTITSDCTFSTEVAAE